MKIEQHGEFVHTFGAFKFNEHLQAMNMPEAHMLDAVAEHLRARGIAVAVRQPRRDEQDQHVDAWFHVGKGKDKVRYAVEVKRLVTPNTLGAVVAQLRQRGRITKKPQLLVASHITPGVADQLAAADQQFADAAGNAYLKTPGTFVLVVGRKPQRQTTRAARDKPGRAFTTAGLKTLFAFICNPQLVAAPYREIAAAAEVALGALPAVLNGLQQSGYLQAIGKKRKLIATRRLLDEWALAHARTLRPKLLLRTLVARTIGDWRNWDLQADRALWGGEPAAALLTRHLKPGVLTIYSDKIPARLIVERQLTTARPNDEHGLVEVRKIFWGNPIDTTGRQARTVPPALVYADLLATGDARCIETAQMIYEGHLARRFPPA